MTTIIWSLRVILAQAIVIFYPGVFVFWLIVHNNIERLRKRRIRIYWVPLFAWFITAGPLLYFRRHIFSIRIVLPDRTASIMTGIGVAAFLLGAAFLSM